MDPTLAGAVIREGGDPAVVADAVVRLLAGRLVAVPTETVYGLAAPTFDPVGIERIYECKGRPADNPLIAHAADVEMARTLVATWPEEAARLAEALWPGPLTMVLPKRHDVPSIATGGRDSVGVRVPAHRVAIEVIGRLGAPVSAPSANRSGSLSPTEARHVKADFVDKDVLVLDGGPCRVGLESTVLDLRPVLDGGLPRVLRPGAVTSARLSEILEVEVQAPVVSGQDDAPGTHTSHYAPVTPLRRCTLAESGGDGVAVVEVGGTEGDDGPRASWRVRLPEEPEAAACLLYAALHAADVSGVERIDLVGPPEGDEWRAVEDRVGRAAAPRL